MPPPIDPEDDDQLAGLYREIMADLTVEKLEEVAQKYDEGYGDRLMDTCTNLFITAHAQGVPDSDFAHLLILNGISALAARLTKDRLSSQN